jgi:ABC-type branched-subunit amino acid transport system permease subunit
MLPAIPALAFWLPGAALSGFGLRRKHSARQRQMLLLAVFALGLGGVLGMTGCGSGHFPSTAPGTYAVQIVGTSETQQQVVPLTVTIK